MAAVAGNCWAADLPEPLAEAVRVVRAVGPEGRGNAEASKAWRALATAPAKELPGILAGFDGANELALNWLATAADAVASRELAAGKGSPESLPLAELGKFLFDTGHQARARQMAFDFIKRVDAAGAARMLPGFLHDPAAELRAEAVESFLVQGKAALAAENKSSALLLHQQALGAARAAEQVERAAQGLRELGQPVDLVRQFGFLTDWRVIGPFDNTGGAGFAKVFPPEEKIDFSAEHAGKDGKAAWKALSSTNAMGIVDINPLWGSLKEVAAYAVTEFHAEGARPAELRLGCKNGWKVWFNGKYLFGRDEYHRGAEIDQYRMPVELQPGANTILVKVCQNEQKEDWTVEWEFQLRVTDALGTPIYSSGKPAGGKRAALN